jgi:NAD(P)-dependent dehydrogenase (short-subunit alcohol dehydrogenase family)
MSVARVAAVTGAGSGIGRALALACAREGMSVGIADVEGAPLEQTQQQLRALGVNCVAQRCDVARPSDVEAFARACRAQLGEVDWLFNNAGVAVLGPAWQATDADWQWLLGVNVLGVANGVRSFVPHMRKRGAPAHVVNTASAAGLATLAGSAVYSASKHAVVAFSECLAHDLAQEGSPIGVSVLCPSLLPTRIHESQRNRPGALAETVAAAPAYDERVRAGMAASPVTADDVAAAALDAIRARRFYVIPHAQTGASVEKRMARILADFRACHPKESP